MANTVSCTDADAIAKVADAGQCREQDGVTVQIMHNGLVVEHGGYYGDWMAEIIRTLRGHHEPQEELVFNRLVSRLADTDAPVMIEFGCFWTYYGLWFCHARKDSRVVGLEPDPANLAVGRRNAALNGFTDRVQFIHGAVGDHPGSVLRMPTESDDQLREVVQHDLASVMQAGGLEHVDLVLSDIQGAESVLLRRAKGDLAAGKVRFMIVSTHHHLISGNPLTHQDALALLIEAGAHVICEHTVGESYSGDGLIAVSFDPRDADLQIEISRARGRESLFGELEYDLADAAARAADAQQAVALALARADSLSAELAASRAELDTISSELAAVTGTKLWRWATVPRQLYARLR
jgi:FkbM family methyltransferase